MKIVYSFNKTGFEEEYWTREIAAASDRDFILLPFNHGAYLDPTAYRRAQLLDNLYYEKHPDLMRMYAAFEETIRRNNAQAVIVDNCFPYHPDYLRSLHIYKVLRTSDGPICAYDRDFPYVHAYDHVLYHSPAYSRDMGMAEKLRYCGARRIDFWPSGVFDALFEPAKPEEALFRNERDIDVIFIGAQHLGKMPFLARIKNALGSRCHIFGLTNFKRNLYFNVKYGFPGWVRTLPFEEYVPLYQRAKIGFNVHNRGPYTVGSYRLFDLPANGVMQISDGGQWLADFYEVDKEVVGYRDVDNLIDKIRYYLDHDSERIRIARNGYRRVMRDYRIGTLLHRARELIARGMQEEDPPRSSSQAS